MSKSVVISAHSVNPTIRVTVDVPYLGHWPLDERRLKGIAATLAEKADEVAETYRFVRYTGEPE